ncbi:UDP-glucose 4-epimerase family protein [Pseudomonas cremoricolorata]|uniref:Ketoreductase domain-containing protein n=1 Tax=Pseudomonas cremoricolorata TaxID=157783 RepID=A0A089WS09_9PSED|nr:SDR family oxidoreductase [Pseudomonas cremoricolorata]AIR89959.1 hypothetical protein LK03_11925 [Pseudomonas cremoricolorata]
MERGSILVTGGNGFVGSALGRQLRLSSSKGVRVAVRKPRQSGVGNETCVGDIGQFTDWNAALSGVEIVVHTAARVHVMNETAPNALDAFRQVNVLGTLNLAQQAQAAGVKRFIYLSSIKVNGESTDLTGPFVADAVGAPTDAYGLSKFEAELALLDMAKSSTMELVIIRPTLVYGPGVQANFLTMMTWLYRRVPLPFGAIDNRRSLVSLANLIDLIMVCIDHPAAAGQTFLASDGDDVSTTRLLRELGHALGRPALLLPVPAPLLRTTARLLGKDDVAQRLLGSLQVDIEKNQALLGWIPPTDLREGLKFTAQAFLDTRDR